MGGRNRMPGVAGGLDLGRDRGVLAHWLGLRRADSRLPEAPTGPGSQGDAPVGPDLGCALDLLWRDGVVHRPQDDLREGSDRVRRLGSAPHLLDRTAATLAVVR